MGTSGAPPATEDGVWDDTAEQGQALAPPGAGGDPANGDRALALRRLQKRMGVAGSLSAPVPAPAWQEGDLEEGQVQLLRKPDGSLHEVGAGAYGKVPPAPRHTRHSRSCPKRAPSGPCARHGADLAWRCLSARAS